MKQYRITTQNIFHTDQEDCLLPEDDPIHQLKIAGMLGGLGSTAKLAEYNNLTQAKIRSELMSDYEEAKKTGIKPGSAAWNAMFQPSDPQKPKPNKIKIVDVKHSKE